MMDQKIWFESSPINGANGDGSRYVFVKISRNGHFQEFASFLKADWSDELLFGHFYTGEECFVALEKFGARVRAGGCVVEKWLI